LNKRVLLLIKGLGRGGAEQLLVNAAPYLDRSRFDYEVAYLLPWKDALVEDLEANGLQVTCLDGAKGPAWAFRMRKLVRDRRIDLVHVHSPIAASAARILLAGSRIPHVYTEHNVWERFHPATRALNLMTFPLCDHVFTVSNNVRASVRYPKLMRAMNLPPLETLYHGPDPAQIAGWTSRNGVRAELGIPEGAPVVGTVANYKTHKGYKFLIEAASMVREKIPDVRFVFVGLGPLESEMRQQVKDLALEEAVVFAGFREDAPRVAGSFDVFTLPSLHEGLSIALIEAMALGKPAVVTHVGGLPEAVNDNVEGLVVPPQDPESLAVALVSLLEDDEFRHRLGENARVRAQAFDIRNAVTRMEEVYEELLAP
jgi:glycosyltransferase involved in cell wall biosynthesis